MENTDKEANKDQAKGGKTGSGGGGSGEKGSSGNSGAGGGKQNERLLASAIKDTRQQPKGGGKGQKELCDSDEEQQGNRKGGRERGEKGKDRRENWKDRDRGERGGDSKKDSWKERRDQNQRGGDRGGGKQHAEKPGEENRAHHRPGEESTGAALLTMLKANPPSATRYTREQLLSIGQLPASKVKPNALNPIIDKENNQSPLLVKVRNDKERRRRPDEEQDDYEEDGAARRDRRQQRMDRGGRRDDDEDDDDAGQDKRRGAQQQHRDQRADHRRWPGNDYDAWKESDPSTSQQEQQQHGASSHMQQALAQQKGSGRRGHQAPCEACGGSGYRYGRICDICDQSFQQFPGSKGGRGGKDPWGKSPQQMGPSDPWKGPPNAFKDDCPQWDMPDSANNDGNILDFTLGDIRQAEKAMAKGVSMSEYKASLPKRGGPAPTAASPYEGELEALQGQTSAHLRAEKEDPFRGAEAEGGLGGGGFFVEEEEDVSRSSRGFGKWFGNRPGDAPLEKPSGVSDAVRQQHALSSPMGMKPSRRPYGESSPMSPSQGSDHMPMGLSSIESLLVDEDKRPSQGGDARGDTASLPSRQEDAETSWGGLGSSPSNNAAAGRSILSMLGRSEGQEATTAAFFGVPAAGGAAVASSPYAHPAPKAGAASAPSAASNDPNVQSKIGKLSVAELFQIAQGKELPPLPHMNAKKEETLEGESAEQKMQREVLKMASQFMWAAHAKAGGQPQLPSGTPFPGAYPGAGGYPGAGPGPGPMPGGYAGHAAYGGMNPAAFGAGRGIGGRGAMMGRGQGEQLFHEAYAQAMMNMGRGGFPMINGPGGRGRGGAGWGGAAGAAHPFGYPFPGARGGAGAAGAYGGHQYGGYGGGFDANSAAQAAAIQAAAYGGMAGGAVSSAGPSEGRGAGRAAAASSATLAAKASQSGGSGHVAQPEMDASWLEAAAASYSPQPSSMTAADSGEAATGSDGQTGSSHAQGEAGGANGEQNEEDAGCSQS